MHVVQPMESVFFYGLFMDADLLTEKGLHPRNSRLAYLTGYGLRIGARATLEYSKKERVFGSIIQLHREELEKLYSDKSVMDYIPRQMVANDMEGNPVAAISYILPMRNVAGSNAGYAGSLSIAARKIGLPEDNIKEIEAWI